MKSTNNRKFFANRVISLIKDENDGVSDIYFPKGHYVTIDNFEIIGIYADPKTPNGTPTFNCEKNVVGKIPETAMGYDCNDLSDIEYNKLYDEILSQLVYTNTQVQSVEEKVEEKKQTLTNDNLPKYLYDAQFKLMHAVFENGDELKKFAFFNAYRNFKNGMKPFEKPCINKVSRVDEWNFCELWRFKGLESLKDIMADTEPFGQFECMVTWYYGSRVDKVCSDAYNFAAFLTDDKFCHFYASKYDQDAMNDFRTMVITMIHENINLLREYVVIGNSDEEIWRDFGFDNMANDIKPTIEYTKFTPTNDNHDDDHIVTYDEYIKKNNLPDFFNNSVISKIADEKGDDKDEDNGYCYYYIRGEMKPIGDYTPYIIVGDSECPDDRPEIIVQGDNLLDETFLLEHLEPIEYMKLYNEVKEMYEETSKKNK